MDQETKVLLIHVANTAKKGPRINLIPMGTFFIADFLKNKGIKTQIIHENLEKQLDNNFSIIKHIKKFNPTICCISINWHQQSTSTIKKILEIKESFPSLKIVTGGFTASYFAEKLLREFPSIDYVIRGDAETPLYKLAKNTDPKTIPNLIWRNNKKKVITNKKTYQISNSILRNASFTNFKLLKNYQTYFEMRMNTESENNEGIFYFSAGRGCNGNCLYCAGGRLAQQKFNNRNSVFYYPIPFIISELKNLRKYKINTWNSCFDPNPYSDFYIKLFKEIRRNKIKLTHHFDCFGLPNKKFIDDFKATFSQKSALNLSPETGSETLRKKIKSFYYTNTNLLETITYIVKQKMNCSVYFSTNQPFETLADQKKTQQLLKEIQKISPKIEIYNQKIDLEPGSIHFENQTKLFTNSFFSSNFSPKVTNSSSLKVSKA
jgi:radical SAM superfamily enzyme YgiQ (UPF0313 family)